jgi:hypothetical protein
VRVGGEWKWLRIVRLVMLNLQALTESGFVSKAVRWKEII